MELIASRPRQAGKAYAAQCTVIAFTGKTGAGKDTAATALADGRGFLTIAFGDALRREICAAWRVDERVLTHRPTKELRTPALAVGMCSDPAFMHWCYDADESLHEPRSPRWVMQQWATYQRRFHPSRYADIVAHWIVRQFGLGFSRVAVTDLRDPVELAALQLLGVRLHVVRVHSPRAVALTADTARHSSERHMIPADFDLCNDASMQALAEAVFALPPVAALSA